MVGLQNQTKPQTRVVQKETDIVDHFTFLNSHCVWSSTRSADKQSHNEDSCMAMELGPRSGVLAVADGAGGHALGDYASALQIDCLITALQKDSVDAQNLREPILNAIEECNRQLLLEGKGSATTITVLEIQDNIVRPYHVGDSSAIVTGQRGLLKLQTLSHSPVALGIEAGLLEPEAATSSDERHLVFNLVGTEEMRIEIGAPITLSKFDTVLLCSDGLTDNLLLEHITEIIRKGPTQNQAEQLRQLCLESMKKETGHVDDLTLMVARGLGH